MKLYLGGENRYRYAQIAFGDPRGHLVGIPPRREPAFPPAAAAQAAATSPEPRSATPAGIPDTCEAAS